MFYGLISNNKENKKKNVQRYNPDKKYFFSSLNNIRRSIYVRLSGAAALKT